MTAAVAQAGSEETILRWSPYVGFTFGALTFLNHLAPAISEPGGGTGDYGLPPRGHSNSLKIFPPHSVTLSPAERPHKPFSCNTYGSLRRCCKQRIYTISKSFSCNRVEKSLHLCLAGLRIRWFDPIAEASELPKHLRSAELLRSFGD